MNKGMIKSTFREIKQSFGRYMAILLIVALGVGLFTGLKVTYKAMIHTGNIYLKDLNFYDYRLLSTLGFDETAKQTIAQEQGVTAAEGVKSADILVVKPGGTEVAVKTMSLPESVNLPDLVEGRMPLKDSECVVDAQAFASDAIGEKITLSSQNTEDDLKKFKQQEFTIVGIVRSPLYVRYDRGTTSIGDGTLDGFLYLPESAYDMDYYTEIYVTFEKEAAIYSDEYDSMIEEKEEEWERICEEIADARYERIYKDAEDEIKDAESELAQKKIDGRKQIADGEQAIKDANATIAQNENTLLEKEKEYQDGVTAYEENKAAFDKGKKAYEKGKKSYNSQYKEYEKGLAEYETNKAEYDKNREAYESAKAQYESGKGALTQEEQLVKEAELAYWGEQLDTAGAAITSAKAQLDEAKAKLAKADKTLTEKGKEIAKAEKQLDTAKETLDNAKTQLSEGKSAIASAKSQLSDKAAELSEAKQEIADGQDEYDKAYAKYKKQMKKADRKIASAKEDLKELDKPDTYVLGRETNAGYVNFDNDSQIVKGVANVFPIFFFLVAALVCITTMTRMMEEQRTQIGVLKALGYSNSAIIVKYMTYSGSAAMTGAVTGFFVGSWLFPTVIWIAYKMMYDMGSLYYIFDAKLAGISILVAFLCSAGTTFVSCRQELQEMAAALMRPKAPRPGKRVLLERIPFIWNRLKFLDKVSVRNLFRYKKRFFMMIIGVSGCTALLVTGMGIKDSIAHIADKQFGEIFAYDMSVSINNGSVMVSGIEDVLMTADKSVDITCKNGTKSISLMVPENGENFESFVVLQTEEGKSIAYPKVGEAVISSKIAETYNIQKGDEITVQNSEMQGGTVIISGICQNYFSHFLLMTPQTYQSLFDEEAEYNTMYVNIKEGENVHGVAVKLMKEDGVGAVSVNADSKQSMSDMMQSLNYIVLLVVCCAAMLAFIVIYNLSNINITERMREIATIKVLGFYKEETNSYIFRENIVLTLLASLVGLVLGYILHTFVMSQINVDAVSFDVHVEPLSYLISVVLTFLFNQIVNFFMSGKLEKINMAESLKSVD